MATKANVIVMHHPKTGRETTALTEKQAAIFEKSGWKRGAKKPAASETTDGKAS